MHRGLDSRGRLSPHLHFHSYRQPKAPLSSTYTSDANPHSRGGCVYVSIASSIFQTTLGGGGAVAGSVTPSGNCMEDNRSGEHSGREEQVSSGGVAEEWDTGFVAG